MISRVFTISIPSMMVLGASFVMLLAALPAAHGAQPEDIATAPVLADEAHDNGRDNARDADVESGESSMSGEINPSDFLPPPPEERSAPKPRILFDAAGDLRRLRSSSYVTPSSSEAIPSSGQQPDEKDDESLSDLSSDEAEILSPSGSQSGFEDENGEALIFGNPDSVDESLEEKAESSLTPQAGGEAGLSPEMASALTLFDLIEADFVTSFGSSAPIAETLADIFSSGKDSPIEEVTIIETFEDSDYEDMVFYEYFHFAWQEDAQSDEGEEGGESAKAAHPADGQPD